MCGGAILAELLASTPARRVTGAHIWPQGWVGTDGFEPAFGEFHYDSDYESDYDYDYDSDSIGALPGLAWQRPWGLSAFDLIPAYPTMSNLESVVSQLPEHEGMPAQAIDSDSQALRDDLRSADQFALDDADFEFLVSLCISNYMQRKAKEASFTDKFAFLDGGAYDSHDSLFSADAAQSNAKAVMGLWSFAKKFAFFDGGAYGYLDSQFGADAAQSNAKAAAGLWSFDNDRLVDECSLSF